MTKKKEKTGLGKFLQKVGGVFPDIIDVGGKFLSGTPVGAVLGGVREVLGEKAENDERAKEFLRELKMNELEWEKEVLRLEIKDRSNARSMYDKSKDFADRLADRIMKWNLWGILGLLFINVGVLVVAKVWGIDESVVLIVGNVVGGIIQALLSERNQVTGFYFGSSLGSKKKDEVNKS